MERREAIRKSEKYQGANIGGKGDWNGSIEGTSSVGDELRKKRRDCEEKSATGQLGPWLKVTKERSSGIPNIEMR